MRVRVQVVIESDHGNREVIEEVTRLERGALQLETLGLTLAEAKALLQGVQRTVVTQQVADYLEQQRCCSQCGTKRSRKGQHEIVLRSLFGKLSLTSPRFYSCQCKPQAKESSSPLTELLRERTAPELLYLEAKFASLMSYGLTVDLLTEVLPIGRQINTTGVRRQLQRVAERTESELGEEQFSFIEGCQRDWDRLPPPGPPLTVGLDGGYVHAREQRSRMEGWFEVIAGKSIASEGEAKCFAFVNTYDAKPKRRLFELLKSQGLAMNQQVVFLSDGGETVRELQRYLSPESEHYLDWFHITMRLTVMGQLAKGLAAAGKPTREKDEGQDEPPDVVEGEKDLERLKWYLWHGNVYRSLQIIEGLEGDLESLSGSSENGKKLWKAMKEFGGYIEANRAFLPNYGDRYRYGETISTAFVESTVNQVISKRMVKKQQMRWSKRGAHLLLQVRTQTLNHSLRKTFCRWYPGMQAESREEKKLA